MGQWLVLVSPCFRENVVATCLIWSFLCSLDNLLQKNVIVFFWENKFQNGAHLKKRAIFDLLSVSPELSSGRDLVIQMSVRRAASAVRRPWFFVRSISQEPYDLP